MAHIPKMLDTNPVIKHDLFPRAQMTKGQSSPSWSLISRKKGHVTCAPKNMPTLAHKTQMHTHIDKEVLNLLKM